MPIFIKNILPILSVFIVSILQAQTFTLGTIPDTQNMTEHETEHWKINGMCNFYVEKKDSLNLIFVASLGDMTQWGAEDQWQRVHKSYSVFDSAQIAYAPCQGNHDWDIEHFKHWFPVQKFETNPNSFYAGSLNNNIANAYYKFKVEGIDFIIVVLQSNDQYLLERRGYSWPSIHWANYVISQHPNHKAILVTHDFYESRGLIDAVITKHDNLIMALCGHSCDREKYWVEKSPSKNTVHCIMADYQCDDDKGATVRYYTFNAKNDMVCAYTYNVVTKKYENDSNSEFCFNVPMYGTGPWAKLGQNAEIYEGAENNSTIFLQLNNNAFVQTLNPNNWALNNLPAGVKIGEISRLNDTVAEIKLKGNSAIGTYSTDNTSITLKINKEELQKPLQFMEVSGIKLTKAFTPHNVPGRIEAEDYLEMEGIKVGKTNDEGPAINIGYLNPNDYLAYKINVAQNGKYKMLFRTSSLKTNGKINVLVNNELLISPNFEQTGGWHIWATTSAPIELKAGVHELKFVVITGDFNINWFGFEFVK